MIRFQQIVEQISERLPSQTNTNDGTTVFTMSISNEMQSIRNQLNQLFANMAREHRQFGKVASLSLICPLNTQPLSLY